MGDMKTPDFDDLLAAFDIPDMVDPKAAIESGHDDHEGQIKHSVHVEEDSHVPPVPDVGVSVIVKNIRNVDATEPVGAEKENHSTGNGLHNGFVAMSSIDRYTKDPGKSLKGEGHGVVTKESSFNQFSPISSAEEFDDDDDDKIEVDDPPDKQKTCNVCQMLLPNQCSFASHQRIHQHKSPYTCPECGAICRSVHFQTHVTKSCLHYTRRVGYRCVHCSVIYSDVSALKSHIQGSHCEIFYKCPICPMAFKSAPGTHSHAYTQHPGIKIGEPKLIYKCSMCDTVFTQQALLYSHFDQHITNQKVSVFKCPDCSMRYAQKQLMLDHIKSMHGTLKSIEGPPNLGVNLPLTIKPTNPITTSQINKDVSPVNGTEKADKKPPASLKKTATIPTSPKKANNPGWMCRECDRLFTQREVYVSHMKREHGKQMKKHPCRQCDKSFSSSHSLCRHNRIKHKGIRKVYTCPHCPDPNHTFSKRLMLEKHIQLMHGIKDADVKKITGSTSTDEVPEKEDHKAPSSKRKLEDTVLEFRPRGAITQPLKKLKINVFKVHKCAVCSFTTEDIVKFHEHIPQHKSDGSSFQCRECGLCYTSHNSLSRHLFIVHKLKEPQPVSKQNGSGEDSQQENKLNQGSMVSDSTSDKKCKVCAKTFETEAALSTHMRTHGMAFIKSKRLNSAEK